jgi:hypothetical protein
MKHKSHWVLQVNFTGRGFIELIDLLIGWFYVNFLEIVKVLYQSTFFDASQGNNGLSGFNPRK